MADPFQPPPGGRVPPTLAQRDPLAQREPLYVDPTSRAPVQTSNSGLGIGLGVGLLFVVVAVLAVAFYRPGESDVAPTAVPAAIEPTNDPAPPVTDAPATDGTAPDVVEPPEGATDPAIEAPAVQP